jgi:tetratricopeptide (TPR) repeat protein
MNLTGKQISFHRKKSLFNPYKVLFLLTLILSGIFLIRAVDQGDVKPFFAPTMTPTRTNRSHILEAQTQFQAGNLNAAISAYQAAIELSPNDGILWAELARIQTYSSASLTTDAARKQRLDEALAAINNARDLSPDSSQVHAIRAFVLDWYASPLISGEQSQAYLTEAEQEAVRALQLDNRNTLALAFYAEILIDSLKWTQAQQYIEQAIAADNTLMDVHRIYGQLWESMGDYPSAIEEYKRATEIMPNMTFLYIYIGANYRRMAANDPESPYYIDSLEYFAKAANIDEQLGIKDPIPYLSISKTYSQMGEFFIASRNVQKALSFDPTNADVYGQLGIVYFKAKNYEGSIPALKCAVYGCNAVESCEARECDSTTDPEIIITGLPISNTTVVYYYTYGSVLAGLARTTNDYCTEALRVFSVVRAQYFRDKDIMSIVQAGEQICQSLYATPVPRKP